MSKLSSFIECNHNFWSKITEQKHLILLEIVVECETQLFTFKCQVKCIIAPTNLIFIANIVDFVFMWEVEAKFRVGGL